MKLALSRRRYWLAFIALAAWGLGPSQAVASTQDPLSETEEDATEEDATEEDSTSATTEEASASEEESVAEELAEEQAPRRALTQEAALAEAQSVEGIKWLKLVGIHRLPPEAYPQAKVRGLYGGSNWMNMHGQQWPYMPQTGIGISGYGWVNTGYEKIRRGDPSQEDSTLMLMEGRFVFRVTPTYTRNHWYAQVQAEFVANNNQSVAQPLVAAADDLWVRVGMWGRKNHNWNVQVGRFEAWELFHLGLGLDLFTLERRGATEAAAVPEIYGVTYMYYRPSGVGNIAAHYYPTDFLRFEALVQYGNNNGQNAVGGRGAGIFDWGWVKIKAGGEYRKETPQSDTSQLETIQYGAGGNLLFVIDPWVEFGANGAWGKTERLDVAGNLNQAGSFTTFTAGGFATVRIYKELLVGGGYQYTFLRDRQIDTLENGVEEVGLFAHTQAFGSIQYFLFRNMLIRGIFGYGRSDMNPTFTENDPYSNQMLSGRAQITRFF